MSGHTKEPWAINGNRIESSAEHGWANDGWIIAGLEGPDAEANAQRIVACVNACAGISNAQLERIRFADDHPSYDEIKQQRDKLLATIDAVKLLLPDSFEGRKAQRIIDAAIASVKGGAS